MIAPAAATPVSGSINDAIRPAIELPSTALSHHISMLRATSSAVKSSPLFHLTPLRTFNVYSDASAFALQLSSRFGVNEPSLLYSTRYSNQPAVKCAICVQSYVRGSFSARTSICMRSVPPAWMWPPACAGVARPSIPYAAVADTPSAVARDINSRRSMWPALCSSAYISATGCRFFDVVVFCIMLLPV